MRSSRRQTLLNRASFPAGARSIVIEGDSITSLTASTYESSKHSYQYDDYRTDKVIEVRAQQSRVVGAIAALNDNSNSMIGNVAEDLGYSPQLITTMIGANDFTTGSDATYRTNLTNYKARLGAVKFAWSAPIAYNPTGTPHPSKSAFDAERATLVPACRNPAVWGLWADYYLPMGEYPDFADAALAAPLFGDSVHPSAAGQLLLYATYKASLDTILDASKVNSTRPNNSVWPASQTSLAISTVITDRIILSGLAHGGTSLGVSVSGSGAEVRLNGGTYGSAIGTGAGDGYRVYNGDVVDVHVTTSDSNDTDVSYDLTIGSETRTITKRTVVAATPVSYTAGSGLTSTASATSQTYNTIAFDAGLPALALTSHSNAGGSTDSTPTAGNVKITPSGGGADIILTLKLREDRNATVSRSISMWTGDTTISAGNYTVSIVRPAAASHNAVQTWTIKDADPTPTQATGNTPAEPSNTNHSTSSGTVPASGMAFAFYLIEDDTTPDAVTVTSPATEFQAEVVAINTSGIGVAVGSRTTTGTVEFTHKTGTYARGIVVFKAYGT